MKRLLVWLPALALGCQSSPAIDGARTAPAARPLDAAPPGGQLTPEQVDEAFSGIDRKAARCRPNRGVFEARVIVTVNGDGTIASVDVMTDLDAATKGCIADVVRTATFPPFGGAPIEVDRTLFVRFKPCPPDDPLCGI